MSAINKVPVIKSILGGLDATQLTTLNNCINGLGGTPIFRSLKPTSSSPLTADDKGIKPIRLETKSVIGGSSLYEGYLIYTDDICAVINFASEEIQSLFVLIIDTTTKECEIKVQNISILELRSELDDIIGAGADESFMTSSGVESMIEEGIPFTTTAPTTDNTNGKAKVVLLFEEPDTRYEGYLYFIVESEA